MHETMVIMRRELKSYFLSPIAYVFGVLFLGLLMFFASVSLVRNGSQADLQAFFGLLPLVFLFFLPALTMRLWAEERKLGTLELLMTFPVRISQLVAGKFVAALVYLAVVLVFTIGLPLTLSVYGALDWKPVLGQYLATLMMASSYIAVGMFWSSMTRDQIIALLLAMVTLLGLYFIGMPPFLDLFGALVPPVVLDIIGGISPYKYFQSISYGVIDTRDLVYYVSFCGFFLYANALVLQGRRHKG
jgi:gliding motility-associated transport system permease protein